MQEGCGQWLHLIEHSCRACNTAFHAPTNLQGAAPQRPSQPQPGPPARPRLVVPPPPSAAASSSQAVATAAQPVQQQQLVAPVTQQQSAPQQQSAQQEAPTPAAAAAAAEPTDHPAYEPVSVAVSQLASDPSGIAAAEVLARLLSNVVAAPAEPKFRRVRLSNPRVQSAVVDVSGGVELLLACGFEIVFEEGAAEQEAGQEAATEGRAGQQPVGILGCSSTAVCRAVPIGGQPAHSAPSSPCTLTAPTGMQCLRQMRI